MGWGQNNTGKALTNPCPHIIKQIVIVITDGVPGVFLEVVLLVQIFGNKLDEILGSVKNLLLCRGRRV